MIASALPLRPEEIRTVCCVCGRVLREADGEAKAVSHGVCVDGPCIQRWKAGDFKARVA